MKEWLKDRINARLGQITVVDAQKDATTAPPTRKTTRAYMKGFDVSDATNVRAGVNSGCLKRKKQVWLIRSEIE